ncbi:PPR domain-containing protein/PPR_2 domain-containing protein, partial [Cephalotus follicularis]
DIKTWNIVLNGWCVLGNVSEAKRFWKDILASKCNPDLFTYGSFIHILTKKGKLGTALKLFKAMWEKGCNPDVVICNCIIDALCFKKRIPQALEVFREMNDRGCLPNVATYNSLIKHLCKIQRMEKVYELVDEMEQKKGSCQPNDITYNYLLKSLKKQEEVSGVVGRMKRNGCKMTCDMYNLILKLYMDWDCQERVRCIWDEMENNGLGPDRRSYTIMIHGLYGKGRIDDALCYFNEMTTKGMVPEPKTEFLTWNIVLNGWCVLGNVSEAKRFWKYILASKCNPESFTYGTYIHTLTKKGKLCTTLKLFRAMWEQGCNPDMVICNCIIDVLC